MDTNSMFSGYEAYIPEFNQEHIDKLIVKYDMGKTLYSNSSAIG